MTSDIFRAYDVSVTNTSGDGLLKGVSLRLAAGECLGLVGESGSGKSLLLRSFMGLVPPPLRAQGAFELLDPESGALHEHNPVSGRGRDMGMIFQDPMSALNPARTVRWTIAEPLRRAYRLKRRQIRERVVELLEQVGIKDPVRVSMSYPHELSGGMRQRVLIAAVLARPPRIILCDEPTTALDTTTQARVVDLLRGLKVDAGFSMIFVSHDLGVVSTIADRVAVLHDGVIVEEGSVREVLDNPQDPYTVKLVRSAPRLRWRTQRTEASP